MWLGGYALLLTVAVMLHGFLVNEIAERLVWDSLLKTELEHHLQRNADDPRYRWSDTDDLQLYTSTDARPLPREVVGLPEGIHDELVMGDREVLVLVRTVEGVKYTLVLDITELESQEDTLTLIVFGLAVTLVLLMGLSVAWGLRRSLRPLTQLAADIGALSPDRMGQRIAVSEKATTELVVIANALNDYLRRHEAFIERERVFIDTTSHELRTPIAIIAGASELALDQPDLPMPARQQVQRIHRTARDVERMIALLLTLAKDPARLSRNNDVVLLHELLPDIIEDHQHLMQGKDLTIVIDALVPSSVTAPLHIVQAAIGNLLRNAIENSDRGEIHVRLDADATVTLEDPGHGMTPEDISRIYAQMARGGSREGGGIGLDLLARLCEHLGWTLSIQSAPGRGTISRLRLSR
ncbi:MULTISPECIES: HAMP domain-containing sensor histidine kinase [unclassified Pseudoxanthomonas]|uniref:sensor histidine kinase n=1 Tax=unclassified Pseudoxanthomonas TaxID=2645906 RepID=UPI000B89FE49|nr:MULTISPECIES: HAMP domain-containing sensor histidine kinase [unclassified Pseudoxanthomonas]PPJ41682.1 sensor histidine kinase [Pseudoxanthomonas sp. KAs_5_3]